MVLKFCGDQTFTKEGRLEQDVVIITDPKGSILDVQSMDDHDPASVRKVQGLLVPGFVNTHCHLELSHMKAKVETGTGLIPFIKNVVTKRDVEAEVILQAIEDADDEMYKNGIVAVGDISNKLDTAWTKSKSSMSYYTFVEMFDFLQPHLTTSTIAQYLPVLDGQSDHHYNKKSVVPHAPYSVSKGLFDFINHQNKKGTTISIHNQETQSENDLFYTGESAFRQFYQSFGMQLDHFRPLAKSSIHYTLQALLPDFRTIFVHNTLTTRDDIQAALAWNNDVFWATCPNANLYIENRLPDYQCFLDTNARVTIGTDSLTSNWQLSIWEEIKTICKYQSYITLDTALQWATINGAHALGYEDRLGSFEKGKTPGIIQITGDIDRLDSTMINRLI